ncbi:MAG: TssQ family T6SS-associated lipoprotein [Hyphomicrobiaceae bacterium]
MKQMSMSVLLCVALLLTACSEPIVRDAGLDKFAPRRAEQDLSSGIRAYENGDYRNSVRLLQNALSEDLLLKSDKVQAYKYLAFIHCAESREKLCREDFRQALALDPEFELSPAESGHPSWGPVFRSLKQ